MQLKFFDFAAIGVYLAVTAAVALNVFGENPRAELVEISSPSGTWLYSLSNEIEVRSDEGGGACLISIHDRSVRVISSDCPKKICIETDSISTAGQWLACLPHRTFIHIRGKNSENVDAFSY